MAARKAPTGKHLTAKKKHHAMPATTPSTALVVHDAPAPDGMRIEMMPILSVRAYGKNPRIIPDSAIDKVAASLKEFGWRQPIVVDEHNTIIVGHTRMMAAAKLGMQMVPVHVARGLTKQQVKAYRLADNRVGQESAWDKDILFEELGDLRLDDYDLMHTGFDPYEYALGAGVDPATEWKQMPEFAHEDKTAHQSITVHFRDADAVRQFAKLVNQSITPKTKYLWVPKETIEAMTERSYVTTP